MSLQFRPNEHIFMMDLRKEHFMHYVVRNLMSRGARACCALLVLSHGLVSCTEPLQWPINLVDVVVNNDTDRPLYIRIEPPGFQPEVGVVVPNGQGVIAHGVCVGGSTVSRATISIYSEDARELLVERDYEVDCQYGNSFSVVIAGSDIVIVRK